jgi:hypothetical protein
MRGLTLVLRFLCADLNGIIGIAAVMLQGLGWVVALMMYSIYTQRLMTSALPSPPTRPGMYVSVGPAGECPPYLFFRLLCKKPLTPARLHCRRSHLPRKTSPERRARGPIHHAQYRRRRANEDRRHAGRSFRHPLRLLVLLHQHRSRYRRVAPHDFYAELVGLYLSQCGSYIGYYTGWQCAW